MLSRSNVLFSALVVTLALTVIVAGCKTTATDPNAGTLEAEVVFTDLSVEQETGPGGGLKLVAITQAADGIGAEFFGEVDEAGNLTQLTGFTSTTGTETFEATVDEQLRLSRVTIGTTDIIMNYDEDAETYSFVVNRDGQELISGVGLTVPRIEARVKGGLRARIGNDDIVECRGEAATALADGVVQDLEDDDSASAEPEFIECLVGIPEIPQVADMVCVADLVMVAALQEALDGCDAEEEPATCEERGEVALQAAQFFSAICVDAAIDVIRQLRENGTCPPP